MYFFSSPFHHATKACVLSLIQKQQQLRDKQEEKNPTKQKYSLQSLGWTGDLSHHLTDLAHKYINPSSCLASIAVGHLSSTENCRGDATNQETAITQQLGPKSSGIK